jgi:hypothetical protein
MATGIKGTATLTFATTSQPAQYIDSEVITDSVPNPNVVLSPFTTAGATGTALQGNTSKVTGNGSVLIATSTAVTSTYYLSSDGGITWVQYNFSSAQVWLVTYGGDKWVAIANSASVSAPCGLSLDGVAWDYGTLPASGTSWSALGYGRGLFMAVNGSLTITSPRGKVWTQMSSVTTGSSNLEYSKGLWFTISSQGSPSAYTSADDGITWTGRTPPTGTTWFGSTTNSAGTLFVVDGYLSNQFAGYSTDGGISFTSVTTPVTARAVAYFNSFWVICGPVGQGAYYSSTGATGSWSSIPSVSTANTWVAIAVTANCITLIDSSGNTTSSKNSSDRTIDSVSKQIAPVFTSPGSNMAITPIADAGVSLTDTIDVWIQNNDSTAEHTAYEHMIAPIKLTAMNIAPGVGFDIVGISEHRLTGTFKVRYARSV